MKKVLIITYYWIPSGGAGVQRWVKFCKYLRETGWEPVIYTPTNPEYPSEDYSFEKDIPEGVQIVKTPIWEPYNIYRLFAGKRGQKIQAGFISEGKKQNWKDKLSIRIRGNLLIPDPRRFWVRPSVRFLRRFLQEHPVDAVITTGPPHSMHLIGLKLKRHFPRLPWIADFRDPWTNIDFYQDLGLSSWADSVHHWLEKQVVQQADAVVVVSSGMQEEFRFMQPRKLHLIPNGYDEDDVKITDVKPDKFFSIAHIGTLNAARNPEVIWRALAQLCAEDARFSSDLQIKLIGKVDYSVIESLCSHGLEKQTHKIDYLPHNEAIAKQQSSQVLLLLINRSVNAKGILTGKFFEYLASGRPVLGVGPVDGDAAEILDQTGAGTMVGYDDVTAAVAVIRDWYDLFKAGKLKLNADSVERFSRRNLTYELSNLLNQLNGDA
jgi:glycosyltransferase involved in cell wall biosynthesis